MDADAWKRKLQARIERDRADLVILDLALDRGDPAGGLPVLSFLTGELSVKAFACSKYIPQEGSDAPDSGYSRDVLVSKFGACDAATKYPLPTVERFLSALGVE